MKSDAPKVTIAGRLSRRLGFSSVYRFTCFVVFGGLLFLFCLLHLEYLDFYGTFCGSRHEPGRAFPGECFYFLAWKPAEIGMLLHLWCIMPAGLLACVQFVPVVRRKAPWVHRVNGYVSMILSLVGALAAVPTIPHVFGGGRLTESSMWILACMPIVAQVKAYIDIKNHRIAQHRAWMLRAWSYVRPTTLLLSSHNSAHIRMLHITNKYREIEQ